MEATAAVSDSGSSGEVQGTQSALSPPESTNVTAPDQGAESEPSPSSKSLGDDPEYDIGGEKVKLSALRDSYSRRRELVKGANQKFEEAAAMRKQVQAVVGMLSSNTEEALRRAGIDPFEWAQQQVAKRFKHEQMSPEERANQEREASLQQREQMLREREEQIQKQVEAETVNRWQQRFEQSFETALEQVGLPKSKRALARMADIAESYLQAGADDVLFTDIAQQVRDEMAEENVSLLGDLPDEAVLSVLPKSVIEKIRKRLLAQVQQPAAKPQQPQQAAPARRATGQKFLTPDQVRAAVAKKIGANQ